MDQRDDYLSDESYDIKQRHLMRVASCAVSIIAEAIAARNLQDLNCGKEVAML